MKIKLATFAILIFALQHLTAQISPPGLGNTKTAAWFAAGIRQDLSSTWQSMSYFGMGRISGKSSLNPVAYPSIIVINQEFYHQLAKNWQNSFAVSFRNQKEKIGEGNETANQKELRLYGRLAHSFKTKSLKITATFRQEFRNFFIHENLTDADSFSFRSRFRLQISMNLSEDQSKKIILSNEQLFSIDKNNDTKNWSQFKYNESRFMLYYSVAPKNLPYIVNIGYMINMVKGKQPYDASYIALDIIFTNPFHKI